MNALTDNTATPTLDVEANATSNLTEDIACYLTNDPQVTQSFQIYLAATILSVATGLIGNTLSFLVFSSKAMLRFSSNVYLLILAVSDSFFLVSVFLSKVLTTLRCLYFSDSSFDVVNRNSVICKLLQYCNDLFSDYSTCLILGFTVERYAAAYLPIAFKRTCTNRRARLVCAATFAFISLFIAPYHALFMGRHIDYNVCTVLVNHEEEFAVLYIVEVVLFRIVPVLAIAVLNVFIIAKVSRITRQRIRIASNERRGTKCSEPDPMRSSGRRRAQTGGQESQEVGIVAVDGIQSSASDRKGVGLTDSFKPGQTEIRALGRIKLILPTRFKLRLPKRTLSCQSEVDIPDKTERINIQSSDLPESINNFTSQTKQMESAPPDHILTPTKITQPKQIDSAELSPHPEQCNFGEMERLECFTAFESSQPDPDRPDNCPSSQPERVEPDLSESHASTQSNQVQQGCPESTTFSQPDTEFIEPEHLASEFAQPARLVTEFIQSERLETAEQQTVELIELKTNSTNGRCESSTRHVTNSTRRKGKRTEEKKGRRKNSERTDTIEERKSGRAAEGKQQERRKDSRRDGQRDDRSLQMTITLILVSTIHVIVFLPVLVHFVIWKLERSKIITVSPAAMQIAQNHTRVLYIAGFAVNFFLYTVSGRMFREQLRVVLWRRRSSARSGN